MAGGEFHVSTATANNQLYSSVTALADGGFVVTWSSYGQDGGQWGIYGQRYDSAGAVVGGEFQVNTYTATEQAFSSVTALSDGGFVVTWTSYFQDGSRTGVYGQRFDGAGAVAGGEFRVNSTTTSDQIWSSVAALADGGFVVTWSSSGQDGSGYGIYGQRYDNAGAVAGGEFQVNTTTTSEQDASEVTALAGGGFVVTWQSYLQDGSDNGIYGQRYDSAGAVAGGEFHVSTATANDQLYPSVTALADGGFVVTWSSLNQDGSGWGVYGQRFDSAGAAVGSEFPLNSITVGDQLGQAPLYGGTAIATLADGRLVATWDNGESGGDVFVRLIDVPAPDIIAPQLLSMVQNDPTLTSAASVSYTVTFSEAVTGVEASQFSLVTTGVSGASIASVTPLGTDGTQYAVTIDTGTGDGTVALAFKGENVRDLSGNALPGGSFTSISDTLNGLVGHITTADLDNDGVLDLVCESGPGTVSIALGNGDGTFEVPVAYAAGANPNGISIGDVDGDTILDLVVSNYNSTGTVSVLLGNGDGTFQPSTVSATQSDHPASSELADVDGDHDLDLIVANAANRGGVSILLGNGDGTFTPFAVAPSISDPADVAVADLNGDGNVDFGFVNVPNAFNVQIYLGNGDGTFTAAASVPAAAHTFSLSFADLDHDNKADLVFTDYFGAIGVARGNGNGTFGPVTTIPVGTELGDVEIVDLDNDGELDLFYTDYSANEIALLFGNGDGTFQAPERFSSGGANPVLAAVGDFSGDGRVDAAVFNGGSGSVSVLLSAPPTVTGPAYTIDKNDAPTAVALANATLSLPENTSTGSRIKVADIVLTDDALGTNVLALSGADAAKFEIIGSELFVKAGVNLDFESQSSLTVTVGASDPTVAGSTPVTTGYTLAIANVNEPRTGGVSISSYTENANNTATLTATNNIADPDGIIGAIGYQWQSFNSASSTWTNIAGATNATYTNTAALVGQQLRVTATYTDLFGSYTLASPQTAIVGNSSVNTLNGTGGVDILIGLAQADILDGKAGADTMVGGLGNDTYVVDDVGDSVVENAGTGTGTDLVQTTLASYSLAANVEKLTFIGTGNFTGTGNALADTITGGAGNNTLDGLGGADRLVGNGGDDTYTVDNASDVVVESSSAGVDTVQTTLASYTLGANVENLSFIGTAPFTGTGNNLANTLTGGNGNDTLTGGAGNDVFVFKTGFGNDLINDFDANPLNPGGAGQDFLDIRAFGLSGTDIGTKIVVAYGGGNATVTIDLDGAGGNPAAGVITLTGVTGIGLNTLGAGDFFF